MILYGELFLFRENEQKAKIERKNIGPRQRAHAPGFTRFGAYLMHYYVSVAFLDSAREVSTRRKSRLSNPEETVITRATPGQGNKGRHDTEP